MQTQTETPETREAVFDESGQTVDEVVDTPDPTADADVEEPATEAPALKGAGKYRIGDRVFDTQEAALEYAQSLETETQMTDAYRQGMRDALSQAQPTAPSVTHEPAADDFNAEELYTNPQAFLNKFATKIKTETRAELDQKDALREQSDQIWREFTERHPALADFRREVEDFVNANTTEVRAIIGLKGRPAGYDYVATKLKSRFQNYANAVKPKRELPNTGGGASPSAKAASVTPKEEPKKALSFYDQLRSIRKRR